MSASEATMLVNTTEASSVFAAAAGSGSWKRTNLGLVTEVSRGGYTWTVELPPGTRDEKGNELPAKAVISGRYGYGGTELLDIEATWGETALIVEAALSATRVR